MRGELSAMADYGADDTAPADGADTDLGMIKHVAPSCGYGKMRM